LIASDASNIGGGAINRIITNSSYVNIDGGCFNLISESKLSSINGGTDNNIQRSCYSAIVGGTTNSIYQQNNTFIVGSNIFANRSCTTFVNNLSIMNVPTSTVGLPVGSVYKDANGFLKIM